MKIQFLFPLLLACSVSAQQNSEATSVHQSIQSETDKVFNKLVEIRRDLHENPELAGHEVRTQKVLEKYLINLGLEVQKDLYGRSLIGILKGGKKGKKIAWRADMDALPGNNADKVSFKSKNKGIWHGCGHDVHMAIGLGIAEVLSKYKKELKGTVYFIFQPEEETFVGAKKMIDNGLFSKISPDEIYGLHVTALPVGQIMTKPEEVFAYQKRVKIELKNTLSDKEVKELSKKISASLSRNENNSKPWEIQYITDPKIGLMNPNTIFKNYRIIDENFLSGSDDKSFSMKAYIYETNADKLKEIIPQIKQVLETNGYKDQLLSVSYIQENPTVFNDKNLTNLATETLEKIYGKMVMVKDYGQVPYFNDDFAFFQQKKQGVYFLLGGSNFKKGIIAMNHTPDFEVDEESIRNGVKSFSSLIYERLK
ncbi:amidohydrolase [Elizabethkingia anophelis]|uniref:Peptidase M20D, amidohydrolase n=2 Tax=Elizabethkingia anophelis TaxID=1117645 RepID=A0A077EGA9_9FLAO|nr:MULTISPECIES: amidohydrolase [Elizabethkingia]AIL46502.1 Peptidase M20D, amidohydrolase [Elizabethkingia anophelis NUHP1]KUF46685.1 amidohydrolase [Elizabethkingia anophelis]MBE9394519.1 amidohydrolase [Elizabethkingia anophelis]MBE9407370.1 amidohydrolase [Elizabethkingia anophelis]MCT3644983.1 amidohydrolase [Elizabethkingia anophelis]